MVDGTGFDDPVRLDVIRWGIGNREWWRVVFTIHDSLV